jgi:hypothetical protein
MHTLLEFFQNSFSMIVTKETKNMIRKRGLKTRKERVRKRVESKGQFESRY